MKTINWKTIILTAVIPGIALFTTGCGTVKHSMRLSAGYTMKPDTKVKVGPVVNQTGEKFDIDIEKMLAEALTRRLQRNDLLAVGAGSQNLLISTQIVEYAKGDAFKRWLCPGWGATVLTVHGELKEGNAVVGTAEALRTVSIGGGYSIGAWHIIFGSVANDIVSDLKKQMPRKR
jgi:hypothetical protein